MSDNVILRSFTKDDIAAITKIYAYYVENSAVSFDLVAPSEAEIAKKYLDMVAQNHPLIIAEIDGMVVGFAYASSYRPRPAYRFTCENSIYIDPNMRDRGLGKLLMSELLKQAKQVGFNQMIAIITSDTGASIALHKKYGFKILGEFPQLGYKFDKWHDIIHMQKKL